MQRLNRLRLFLSGAALLSLFVLLVATGCSFGPAQTSGPAPYKIGVALSFTGYAGSFGQAEKEAIEVEVEKVNKAGGINGRKLELFYEDDQSEPSSASVVATRLINDKKIDVLIGGTLTSVAMPMIPVVEGAGVPYVTLGAGGDITDPIKKWVFRIPMTDKKLSPLLLEYVSKDLKAKKVAVLHATDASGVMGTRALKKLARNYGVMLVAIEKFDPSDTNMTPQLAKIKATDVQALIVWGSVQGVGVISKNYRQLGMNIPVVTSHASGSMKFFEVAGDAGEGFDIAMSKIRFPSAFEPNDPWKKLYDVFDADLTAKFSKKEIDGWYGNGYDAIHLAMEGLKAAGGSDDKEKIRGGLENATFQGLNHKYKYAATDHDGIEVPGIVIGKVQGRSWKLVKRF